MHPKINKRTGIPNGFIYNPEITDQDFKDSYALRFWKDNHACPNCKTALPDSYSVLEKLWDVQKKLLIYSGTEGVKTEAARANSDIKWAILRGYLEAVSVIDSMLNHVESKFDEKIESLKTNNIIGGTEDEQNGIAI